MQAESPQPGSPPGWYPDPESPTEHVRWWSGTHWTAATKLRASPVPLSGRIVMVVLTVMLSPALLYGGLALLVLGAPSDPGPPEDRTSDEGPGQFEVAGSGLGAFTIALVAIFFAWRSRRLPPRLRIGSLMAGIVLTLLWLAFWFDRLS